MSMDELVRRAEEADRGKPRCAGCGTTALEDPRDRLCPWCEALDSRYVPLTNLTARPKRGRVPA